MALSLRLLLSLCAVATVSIIGYSFIPVNATTVGFAYVLVVLVVATLFGFIEALVTSIAATLAFNFFFLPPVGRLTIADPQNWVALVSFLVTSLIASRLSAEAKRRTRDALESKQDVERLYTFSRAILLLDTSEAFPKQLVRQLAEIFELHAVVLYVRRTEEFHRAGPLDFEGLDDQLRDAALLGTNFSDAPRNRVITAIRLGSEPIAGLALQGAPMPDSALQGVANLVAIGLERAYAQDLSSQIEAAKQSEKLRTTLLDAMAHEFKTPLTSVMAATSSLRADPNQPVESRVELVRSADEAAHQLKELINDAVEMGRLDNANIELLVEPSNLEDIVREVVAAMQPDIDTRHVEVVRDSALPAIAVDRRLVRLAIKQLLDNALKYSPENEPVTIHVQSGAGVITVAVTDHGHGISPTEQGRIFDRFHRSPAIARQVPGSGLGLSIAKSIARAHHGDVAVTSRAGETTFQFTLPAEPKGNRA